MKQYIVLGLMLVSAGTMSAVDFPQSDFQSTSSMQMSNSSLSSTVETQATIQEYYTQASAPGMKGGPAKLPGIGGATLPDTPDPEDCVYPIGEVPMLLLALLAAAVAFARKRRETQQLEIED